MELQELRIHGVSNTPPAEMLETESDGVVRVDGDTLGSFWARRDDPMANGVATPVAFSWGAQARTGGGATQAIVRALVHVGWFLLLPYALVNLAYWTREIPAQESGQHRTWEGGVGAGIVRLFGLILTLIAVAAFSAVAIDLVAVQCFRRVAEGTDQVCAALPTLFDGLRAFDADSRAALLGLIPIAVVFVLYWIGRRGRVRFDAPVEQFAKDIGGKHEKGLPLLSTRGFWAGARVRSTSEWLHVAASILLVLFLLSFDAAFPGAKCVAVSADSLTIACLGAPRPEPLVFVFVFGAVIGIIIVGALVVLASSTPMRDDQQPAPRRMPVWMHDRMTQPPQKRIDQKRWHALVSLIAASTAYGLWLLWTSFVSLGNEPGAQPQFTGLIGTPIVLMTLALFLALSALNWRQATPRLRTAGYAFLWVGGIALLIGAILPAGIVQWLVTVLGAAVVLAFLVFVRRSTKKDRAATPPPCRPERPAPAKDEPQFPALRFRAWDGHGAAVGMMLALFASMALSSLLVLGLAAWLGAPQPTAADRLWRSPAAPPSAAEWNIPDAYERFAVVLTVIVALTLILLVVVAFSTMRQLSRFTLPHLSWTSKAKSLGETSVSGLGGVAKPCADYPVKLETEAERTRLRATTRRFSHLAHRGEPLFAWISALAMTGFITLASPALFDFAKWWLGTIKPGLPGEIRTMTTAVLVALAVVAVGAVVANAVSSGDRPLGVFWDVVAFFPRAGHPFAPPCFAERTVPELAEYMRRFLQTTGTIRSGVAEDRTILLTAHSMGSTIAAATILSLRGERVGHGAQPTPLLTDRIAMLSYGSQLRAYFSRFFPAVFGRQVLGVPGLLGPSLFGLDPWKKQVEAEFKCVQLAPPDASPHSLTGMLGAKGREVPRWRNLWRRTDFLGFPVYAYRDRGNPVDRGASETAPGYMWRIATHSDYLAVDQLELERENLAAALRST